MILEFFKTVRYPIIPLYLNAITRLVMREKGCEGFEARKLVSLPPRIAFWGEFVEILLTLRISAIWRTILSELYKW